MKLPALLSILALGCLAALGLRAAEPAATDTTTAPLTTAQIDELLAPIALYPDPLVAIILPASTFPTDIVMAARYLDAQRDPEAIDDQPWDDSVKSLARYPDVVKWMDENLEWTQQLGAAFTLQPAALLTGTQRLRAAAIAAGNLKTTTEQTVIVEKEVVRIVPAQREVIYVPVYDPYWVYRPWPAHTYHHPRPVITFSSGYHTGFWLSYHLNWGSSAIVIVNRPYRTVVWHNYPAWHYPSHTVVHHHHVWRPSPVVVHKVRRDYHRRPFVHVAQPTVNVHVQRNVTRNVNRDVNITRNVNRERDVTRDVTRERDINRERTVNRPANANNTTPAPRREITARSPEDFRRQTRPENHDATRDVVRRPVTNAPDPVRAPGFSSPRERDERRLAERPSPANRDASTVRPERVRTGPERTERTPNENVQRTQPNLRSPAPAVPTSRPVVTTPRPAPARPALTPSQDPMRTRGGPVARPAPQVERQVTTPRPQRMTPANPGSTMPAPAARIERTQRPNMPARTPPSATPPQLGVEEQTGPRGFNRTR